MFIGSGFGLNRVSAAGDAYGILNGRFRPALVMDFGDEYYMSYLRLFLLPKDKSGRFLES
jgi:hypothetical protein